MPSSSLAFLPFRRSVRIPSLPVVIAVRLRSRLSAALLLTAPVLALAGVAGATATTAPVTGSTAVPPGTVAPIKVGTVWLDEGSNFTQSQTVTVHYKGFGLYERFFVQQCWTGPGAGFDFSVSCHPETMIFPGLTDREEGTVKFQLFVGDDPYGAFPISCGPKTNPEYLQVDTCYIRAVTYDLTANDRAAFFPITFTGARPATTSTTAPVTLAPDGSETTVAAATTSTLPVPGPTTTGGGPKLSVGGSSSGGGSSSTWWQPVLFVAGVAGLLITGYGAWKRRRPAR